MNLYTTVSGDFSIEMFTVSEVSVDVIVLLSVGLSRVLRDHLSSAISIY